MHLYLEGKWYECTRPIEPSAGPLDVLDVAVLQKIVLEGMLDITDPRGDARLQFLGGARPVRRSGKTRGRRHLPARVCDAAVRVGTVLAIADAGGVMPPKSTWFEPKLLSGLVIHPFS